VTNSDVNKPLAVRLRPSSLKDFVGQQHLVGEGAPLRQAIENMALMSFILWGPPGSGKTTLARIYGESIGAEFFELSAVAAGKDDVRKVVKKNLFSTGTKLLFLDEIHRFNKAQQDYLLPFVESGELLLVGATTENPSFEVIPALLSRLRVFVLNKLSDGELAQIIKRANIPLTDDSLELITRLADGDARIALTILENTIRLYGQATPETIKNTAQKNIIYHDKAGEQHYNLISAFIKSMRASDPDAALYYLARMIEGGEDPKFIARRMVIFASEDVGLAEPSALFLANEVFRAVETIGLPECVLNLAHGATYLALAPKSRKVTDAITSAIEDVRQFGNLPVPLILRNAPTQLMRDLGYGRKSDNDADSLLPEKLTGRKYLGEK
jgi:putative ATPase